MAGYKTSDMKLSERLQKEGFHVVGITVINGLRLHTLNADEKVVVKHLNAGKAAEEVKKETEEPKKDKGFTLFSKEDK